MHYTGRGGPLSLRALDFRIEGATAFIIGGYSRAAGEPDVGKFTLTLVKGVDGNWLIFSDMDSGNGGTRKPVAAPTWFAEHIRLMTNGDGRWFADNSDYQSDDEPFDQYGLEWTSEMNGNLMRGRLFGVRDGEETGAFWTFSVMWDPARGRAMVYQVGGDGTLGVGHLTHSTRGEELVMDFTSPAGSSYRTRHTETTANGVRTSESFQHSEDGWQPSRTYHWRQRQ